MRIVNFKVFTAVILAVVMLSGCGLSKMIKKYPTVKFKATPEVLESNGGRITVQIDGTFPAKYFHKKAKLEIVPVLTNMQGVELTKLKSITLKGEKAVGDGQTINYKTGGTFTYTDVFDYNPNMNASELFINPAASLKKKTDVKLGQIKLADGVVYTSERVVRDEDLQVADHGYELETIITHSGNLYFEYNKSNLNTNLALNKDKANADTLAAVLDFLKKNWKVKSIDINAWASPEGELTLNQKLSDERGKVGNTWFIDQVKKMIKAKALTITKPEELAVTVAAKGEDFDGFMKALQTSNMPQKETITNVIKSQENKAAREKAMKDMTVIYTEVETMLSVLRRSEIKIACYLPKKSKEEIMQLSTSAPEKLDNKELLYAATLTDNMETKYTIYKSATTIYPQDWKNFCNAGYAAMNLGKLDEAATYLDKANTLKASEPKVLYNIGVLNFWNKKNETADSYFNQAKAGGIDVSYNMGLLKIRKGDYTAALNAFGAKKCKNNIALAQLLSGNASGATTTLGCVKPMTAADYYLLAIAGARSGNTSQMYENISKAISADAAYRSQAKEDREFLKYFKEAAFQEATK
jgi:Flp pilus assembly protein TadD